MPTLSYHSDQVSLLQPGLRPTLFNAAERPNDMKLGIECARLAYVRTEDGAAELTQLTDALAAAGFGSPTTFSDATTDAHGYGAVRADGSALLAFRGTQAKEIKDLLTDIAAIPVPWPEAGGNVHYGFARSMRSLVGPVQAWVKSTSVQPARLLVCGHSLGAALATLASSVLQPATLITIGSPRVGDAAFAQSIQSALVLRVVDCCDVVTHVPTEGPHYTHVGDLWYIDRNGMVTHAPADSVVIADQIRARLDYGLSGLDPDTVPTRDFADHAPINYARAFF